MRILEGDCLEVMRTLDANSVDAIVTDPPYHLTTGKKGGTGVASDNPNSPAGRSRIGTGFMGMAWDGGDVAMLPETWAEALRVAKPGAYLAAFGGTRTYHRMACAMEDAGWELRDTLMWVYGSGFPKSLDVSKAIDRAAGAEREVIGPSPWDARKPNGSASAHSVGLNASPGGGSITAAASDEARQWQGWGTALKPAWEPIILARKPLSGTVAANVLAYGTGALNIDGCRIAVEDAAYARNCSGDRGHDENRGRAMEFGMTAGSASNIGRWPANLVHDGSEEVVAAFPDAPGQQGALTGDEERKAQVYGKFAGVAAHEPRGDVGSAARFFYCAKASREDRNDGCRGMPRQSVELPGKPEGFNPQTGQMSGSSEFRMRENHHPTVKPTDLMRWLCRLVTPKGGLILDPFMGSGSTGRGAILEGFEFVGVELSPEYAAIAKARIEAAIEQRRIDTAQMGLFEEVA